MPDQEVGADLRERLGRYFELRGNGSHEAADRAMTDVYGDIRRVLLSILRQKYPSVGDDDLEDAIQSTVLALVTPRRLEVQVGKELAYVAQIACHKVVDILQRATPAADTGGLGEDGEDEDSLERFA